MIQSFERLTHLLHARRSLVREDVRLENDFENLVGGRVRLRNDAPHSKLVQDLGETLMVVLLQRGIEAMEHRHFDAAQICNACHGVPLSAALVGEVIRERSYALTIDRPGACGQHPLLR